MRPLASVPDGYDRYLEIWHKLPPVIRSAVLVNDIRKTLLASAGQEFNLRATHLKRGDVYGFGEPSGTIPLTIEAAQRFRSGWRFVEHWTRDERHPATCSARRLLTPTWAGPSGHVAKNLAFYRMFLPPGAYPASADTSIAAALFAVWRLYYDRRYSPTHTLVETCEGTTYNTDLTRVDLVRRRVSQDGNHDHDDAFSLFGEALLTVAPTRIASRGAHFTGAAIPPIHPLIDGVTVLELMRRRAFLGAATANTAEERLAAVDAAIDARRTALTQAGYVVPRWSHELDPTATGTAVTNFAPPDAPAGRRRRRQPQGAGAT
jgi:hypothetical protein